MFTMKMDISFVSCLTVACLLNNMHLVLGIGVPPPTNYNYNYNNGNNAELPNIKLTTEAPYELFINFTFPKNGLPPMKMNLGNVAEYLTEKPGIVSSPKRTVLIDIKNPNRPQQPIPADIYAAGLPPGSLIPGDVVQPCRDVIVNRCNDLCFVTLDTCRSMCDGRNDCLTSCRGALGSCRMFCNSTFTNGTAQGEDMATPSSLVYLPKCLRNCMGNATCNNLCHYVCHYMLEQKPTYYGAPPYNPYPGAPPSNSYPAGSSYIPYPGAPPSNSYPGAPSSNPYPGAPPYNLYPGAPPSNPYPGPPPYNPYRNNTLAAPYMNKSLPDQENDDSLKEGDDSDDNQE